MTDLLDKAQIPVATAGVRYVCDNKIISLLRGMQGMSMPLDVYISMASGENSQYNVCVGTWVYNTFLDILYNGMRYNGFTDKQAALIVRLAKQLKEEHLVKAAREAERANAEDCPSGRRMISGKIIKTKWQEGPYGDTFKILVKDDRGFIVFLTGHSYMKVGGSYSSTVTITPSDKDPKFGFGKRPSNYNYADPKPAAGEAEISDGDVE